MPLRPGTPSFRFQSPPQQGTQRGTSLWSDMSSGFDQNDQPGPPGQGINSGWQLPPWASFPTGPLGGALPPSPPPGTYNPETGQFAPKGGTSGGAPPPGGGNVRVGGAGQETAPPASGSYGSRMGVANSVFGGQPRQGTSYPPGSYPGNLPPQNTPQQGPGTVPTFPGAPAPGPTTGAAQGPAPMNPGMLPRPTPVTAPGVQPRMGVSGPPVQANSGLIDRSQSISPVGGGAMTPGSGAGVGGPGVLQQPKPQVNNLQGFSNRPKFQMGG
jgi:hypothetical protein